MNYYYSHHALPFSWKHFTAMNRHDRAVVFCEDVERSRMYWELYKEFFKYKCRPTFASVDEAHPEIVEQIESHVPWIVGLFDQLKDQHIFTDKLRKRYRGKTDTITYSYHDYETNKKGISLDVKLNLMNAIDGINLGGWSGDDYDILHLKIATLAESKLFIGTDTSWGNICCHFGVPAVRLYQINPFFSSIGEHCFTQYPRM